MWDDVVLVVSETVAWVDGWWVVSVGGWIGGFGGFWGRLGWCGGLGGEDGWEGVWLRLCCLPGSGGAGRGRGGLGAGEQERFP